jgi:hypothetical protein
VPPHDPGRRCRRWRSEATITYAHTSLGAAGDAFVESFTEDYYRRFMQDWEVRMNHYLRHGTALR